MPIMQAKDIDSTAFILHMLSRASQLAGSSRHATSRGNKKTRRTGTRHIAAYHRVNVCSLRQAESKKMLGHRQDSTPRPANLRIGISIHAAVCSDAVGRSCREPIIMSASASLLPVVFSCCAVSQPALVLAAPQYSTQRRVPHKNEHQPVSNDLANPAPEQPWHATANRQHLPMYMLARLKWLTAS